MTLAWRSCPHCGAISAEQSRFCASCGLVFPQPASVEHAVAETDTYIVPTEQTETRIPLILSAIGILMLVGMVASGFFFVW